MRVRRLLTRLEFLSELPERLSEMIDKKNYQVQRKELYSLMDHVNLPSYICMYFCLYVCMFVPILNCCLYLLTKLVMCDRGLKYMSCMHVCMNIMYVYYMYV